VLLLAVTTGLAISLAACSTSITTPLPDVAPISSRSMSQKQRDEAMKDLDRRRDSHAAEAEREIENSR